MKILVTAGPTREKIDPVRFISNYSTGRFGYEIAAEAARLGHDVTLVSGPTALEFPRGVKGIRVESALEMKRAVTERAKRGVCVIMAAAVCDWRVAEPGRNKIKRHGKDRLIKLKENPDILAGLGKNKKGLLVGFALETGALERNALAKLKKKKADIIIANRIAGNSGPFGNGLTDILIMDSRFGKSIYRRRTKKALAKIILDKISNFKI
ncbi:MAG: phosphopantothenoylcysteine decarboxylase [Candidatus Omnitrophota bacterium]